MRWLGVFIWCVCAPAAIVAGCEAPAALGASKTVPAIATLHGQHAFTWTAGGGMVDNGSQNPNSNSALAGWNAINNNGLVAGTSYILSSPF